MKSVLYKELIATIVLIFLLQWEGKSTSLPEGFKHEYAQVNGLKIHYVKGGTGAPLVLLHGFGQNWFMWNRILPQLSKTFTVIAPDLRGVGDSDKPETGYDKRTMAEDIHQLVRSLGFEQINLAGHDIGLMVAYAYAKKYPGEIKKLALMDAIVPGVETEWTESTGPKWWFGFFKWPTSDEIIANKEQLFFDSFWKPGMFQKNSFTKEERKEFISAYSKKGSLNGSFSWFRAFDQDVTDNIGDPLLSPNIIVLAIGGDHSNARLMTSQMKSISASAEMITLKDCGHWLVQEQTQEIQTVLQKFFN